MPLTWAACQVLFPFAPAFRLPTRLETGDSIPVRSLRARARSDTLPAPAPESPPRPAAWNRVPPQLEKDAARPPDRSGDKRYAQNIRTHGMKLAQKCRESRCGF